MLRVYLLGNPLVEVDGQSVSVDRRAGMALLAYLTVESKRVGREQLATLLWPEADQQRAFGRLRRVLYALTKTIGEGYLAADRTHITLAAHWSDVAQLTDAGTTLATLEQARDLMRGDFMQGFTLPHSDPFERWQQQQVTRFRAAHDRVLDRLATHYIEASRYDDAIALVRQQVLRDPIDEKRQRRMIRLLHQSGQHVEAIRQYERLRAELANEFGVAPSAETQSLIAAIRAEQIATRHNLPNEITRIIGRKAECQQLQTLFRERGERLVTLVGLGGSGKTRLATAFGHEQLSHYQDGVFLVKLAPVTHAQAIPTAIATAIGFQPPAEMPLWTALCRELRLRQMLLILDNFEHLLDGSRLLNELLEATQQLVILVTSRLRLPLHSSAVLVVNGLAHHERENDAMELFATQAQRVRPVFRLERRNRPHVQRICKLVAGLPLPLILAAAWCDMLSTAEIADEIERGMQFLSADLSDLPDRQRSITAVFEHSWQRLSPAQQTTLARLTVFRAGFTLEAAIAIASASRQVLHQLCQNGLVQRLGERYELHDLLRQFATSKREERDNDLPLRHCRYFARFAQVQCRYARYTFRHHWMPPISADSNNIWQAWHYAHKQRMVTELAQLTFAIMGLCMESGEHAYQILGAAAADLVQDGVPENDPALLHIRATEIYTLCQVDPKTARNRLNDTFPLIEQHADFDTRFFAAIAIQFAIPDDESFEEDRAYYFAKAAEIAQEGDDPFYRAYAEQCLTRFKLKPSVHDPDTILKLEQQLVISESNYPQRIMTNNYLATLVWQYLNAGQPERALNMAHRNAAMILPTQDLYAMTNVYNQYIQTYEALGRIDEARRCLRQLLDDHLAIGSRWQTHGMLASCVVWWRHLFVQPTTVPVQLAAWLLQQPETMVNAQRWLTAHIDELAVEIGQDLFTQAWNCGQQLTFDAIIALVKIHLTH